MKKRKTNKKTKKKKNKTMRAGMEAATEARANRRATSLARTAGFPERPLRHNARSNSRRAMRALLELRAGGRAPAREESLR